MLAEITHDTQEKFDLAINHLTAELSIIRSSHTSPSLIEEIKVSAYEGTYPLKEVTAISTPEPNLLVVQPWDASIIQNIETALMSSDIGITPVVDNNLIRLPVPPLSQERREEFIKKVGQIAENSKVAIRNIRQDKMKSLDDLEKESKISQDERDSARKEIQTLVDKFIEKIDSIKDQKVEALKA